MERLYSISDAAETLGGVSERSVEAWLSSGRLRRTKVGRRTMIAESDLQRFVDESTGDASRGVESANDEVQAVA